MPRQGSIINNYREQLQQQAGEAAAMAERNRLARDLHDSIKQQIFSIRMSALVAQNQLELDIGKARVALADIQQSATEAQTEMQALLQQLRPSVLENTSFEEAVQTQARALEYRSGVQVRVNLAPLPPLERCPLSMQEAMFRIIQETFANIARHARANQVECNLTCDDETLNISMRDDGQGFDLQSAGKGMGLANIQERARGLLGSARIESSPGRGTSVDVRIPLLLPAETQLEQEKKEQRARDLFARVRAGLHLRSTLAIFVLLTLLVDLDLGLLTPGVSESSKVVVSLILVFCVGLMFYGLVSARVALAQVAKLRSRQDREVNHLRLQGHIGWVASLRLILFGSWHVVIWIWRLLPLVPGWQKAVGLLVLGGLALVWILYEQYCIKRAQERYYHLLPEHILKLMVVQRRKTIRLRIIMTLCVAISFAVQNPAPLFSPVLLWRWLAYSFLFAFFMQCFCLGIDIWLLRPWRKLTSAVV